MKWSGREPVEDWWARWDFHALTAPRAAEVAFEVASQKWLDAAAWWLGGLRAAVETGSDWWIRSLKAAAAAQAAVRRSLGRQSGR